MKKSILLVLWLVSFLSAYTQDSIRGTWITNVASKALLSKKNIIETVQQCKQKGFNNIYVVVWNYGVTTYPSQVVEKYIGIKQSYVYKGFDPIACIVEEGHKQGLKVHAWFEYGFSYTYKNENSIWLKKYPHWVGRNSKGDLLQKNGFYWWSAMHPEVQQFMRELVTEVVRKYDIDGVQGDDRLPAMPAEGGYDSVTQAMYQAATGTVPPADAKEKKWLQWKADQLSMFGKNLYAAVKAEKPNCIVSWAPSIYPWSVEQYLQDWPTWLRGGYADYIMPQVYRYDIKAYKNTLEELAKQLTPEEKKKVYPGILTSLGNGYLVKETMLREMIALNRAMGFAGECFFYYETLPQFSKIY